MWFLALLAFIAIIYLVCDGAEKCQRLATSHGLHFNAGHNGLLQVMSFSSWWQVFGFTVSVAFIVICGILNFGGLDAIVQDAVEEALDGVIIRERTRHVGRG